MARRSSGEHRPGTARGRRSPEEREAARLRARGAPGRATRRGRRAATATVAAADGRRDGAGSGAKGAAPGARRAPTSAARTDQAERPARVGPAASAGALARGARRRARRGRPGPLPARRCSSPSTATAARTVRWSDPEGRRRRARSRTCSATGGWCRARSSSRPGRRSRGKRGDLKPGTLPPEAGHEQRRRARRADRGPRRRTSSAHDSRGAVAARGGAGSSATPLRGDYLAATRRSPRARPARATAPSGRATSRASCSRPPTSSGAARPVRAPGEQQLAAFKREFRERGPALRAEQEPHPVRRADDRLDGGARGPAAEGAARWWPR